ncbi:VWA domain-containing protein [Coraliomargarita parva]|uniref:VWA domain-containing protein n=1 Tax=Coraliomargarita parva TaxID=3014050 RepID=UPI0022B56EA4|nr:VWA domain-containing protein [Coraliomargarita parva]
MTFASHIWLYLTPLVTLLVVALIAYGLRKRSSLLQQFAAARLLEQLTEKASLRRILIKATLLSLACTTIGLALARPQYGVEWTERKARGLDIVFVLDSSKSMLATDLRPTRLDRAKLAILDLIERLESDRIGLVIFAGQAFLQTPPTLDYAAFRENLEAVSPSSLTRGGSDLGGAIDEAAKAFPTESNVKVVVLLTDGEDLGGSAQQAAERAKAKGIQIHSIGFGTPEGDYLRIRNEQGIEEFVRDEEGQPVRSQLDETTLREIAETTGGLYSQLEPDTLQRLYNKVLNALPREERESEMQEVHIERFQWAIGAALILLVVEGLIRRRGQSTVVVLIAAACLYPSQSRAEADKASPEELYNQAYANLVEGHFETAAAELEGSINESGDLGLQRDALYNLGHAYYQQGQKAFEQQDFETALQKWKQAEDFYQSAVEMDPKDQPAKEDAKATQARRKALEDYLENQKQQQQQNQDEQEKEQSEQDQQDQQQSGDSQDQQGQDQQGQEQQGQEQQSGDSQDQQSQNQQGESGQQGQDQQGGNQQQPGESGQEQQGQEQSDESPSDKQQQPDSGEQGEQAPQPQPSEEGEKSEQQGEDRENNAQQGESMEQEAGEPGQQASGEEGTDEASGSMPVPEVDGENETSEAGPGTAMGTEPVEGMSTEDARALLNSLQSKEQLLPFVESPGPRTGGHIRDW